MEEDPKKLGESILINPQNSIEKNTFFSKKSINQYKKRLQQNDNQLKEHFLTYGIRYIKIYNNENIVKKLIKLFT